MKNLLLLILAMVINNQITYGQEVTIGTQTWMQKNLDVSKYRDGTPIPQVTNPKKWLHLTTGAWCYYENKTANGTIYGKLYNWYAVAGIYDAASAANPALRKKLAPQGWHVPSDAEWTTLTTFLGGEEVAGGKMKSITLWNSPNTAATNTSGFTGLPAGKAGWFREFDEIYGLMGWYCYWWSSSEDDGSTEVLGSPYHAWSRELLSNWDSVFRTSNGKNYGFSVRCLRD